MICSLYKSHNCWKKTVVFNSNSLTTSGNHWMNFAIGEVMWHCFWIIIVRINASKHFVKKKKGYFISQFNSSQQLPCYNVGFLKYLNVKKWIDKQPLIETGQIEILFRIQGSVHEYIFLYSGNCSEVCYHTGYCILYCNFWNHFILNWILISIKCPFQKKMELKILTKKLYSSYGYSAVIVVNVW